MSNLGFLFLLLIVLFCAAANCWYGGCSFFLRHRLTKLFRGGTQGNLPKRKFKAAPVRRSGGRKKPAWVVDEVIQLFTGECFSFRRTQAEFNRRHAKNGMTISLGTVYAWVRKYCSEAELVRVRTRHLVPNFSPANLRWNLDGTGKVDATGKQHFILGMVDYGTRFNLCLERLGVANSTAILRCVLRCVKQYGKPKIIKTDNASVFKSAEFEHGLQVAGIRHEFSDPGKPWQNGRIERLFLTLKEKLNLIVPISAADLDELLAEFRFWYNAVRPHQHLHHYTPLEVWAGVNPFSDEPKQIYKFIAWEGLLQGFYMRH